MCTGVEIAGIASALLSTVGGVVTMSEQNANAERMKDARNEELRRHLLKNDQLAETTRDEFARRNATATADGVAADQQAAQADREATLNSAVADSPSGAEAQAVTGLSSSGSAPTVVRAEMAKRMSDAVGKVKGQAKNAAKLGAYGDSWMQQGFADLDANRNISVDANAAAGNSALLPYQQDFAETRAYKPISPLGGILQGLGGALGSTGGSFGTFSSKKVDPWKGMR